MNDCIILSDEDVTFEYVMKDRIYTNRLYEYYAWICISKKYPIVTGCSSTKIKALKDCNEYLNMYLKKKYKDTGSNNITNKRRLQ